MHSGRMTSDEFKALRKALGDNQTQFAARLGIDQSAVSRWEKRGVPRTGPARMAIEMLTRELQKTPVVAE